jgi:hypothetical protein
MNNVLGIMIRLREGQVAFAGDIRKMYHAIKMSIVDQHTHRFLWRDDEMDEPDTYVMTSVSFGNTKNCRNDERRIPCCISNHIEQHLYGRYC